jgi:hypothetical protein
VYFVSESGDRRSYLEKIGRVYELASSGGKFVFTNRPSPGTTAGIRRPTG